MRSFFLGRDLSLARSDLQVRANNGGGLIWCAARRSFHCTAQTLNPKHKIEAVFEVEIEQFLRREGPAAGRAHPLWGLLELCVSPLQGVHGLLEIKDTHHPRALR